jgi:hypothetical protein
MSAEPRFGKRSDNKCRYFDGCECGTRNNSQFIRERPQSKGGSLMVWARIIMLAEVCKYCTELYFIL